nr:receptor-type tyrosine-protein phosphatase F-like [Onthophagus taurus]
MFRLIVFLKLLNVIIGNIVLFDNYYNTNYCVDTNQTIESALVWMKSDTQFYSTYQKNYVCRIDNEEECIRNNVLSGAVLRNSLNYATGYLLDNRWNDLKQLRTYKGTTHNFLNITSDTFSFSFSLRIPDNGYLYICDDNLPWEANNCYFFVLNGWSNNTLAIRRCYKKEIKPHINDYPSNRCRPIREQYSQKGIVSKSEWNHFKIDVVKDTVSLYHYKRLQPLFTFIDNDPFIPTNVIIRSKEEGFWKLHNYNFLTIKDRSIWKGIKVSSICLKVYVKPCLNCNVHLAITDRYDAVLAQKLLLQENDWQSVILSSNKSVYGSEINLLISVGNISNEHTLIGDILECSSSNYINYIERYNNEACCHSIKSGSKICRDNITPADRIISNQDACPSNTFGNTCLSCNIFNNCRRYGKYYEITSQNYVQYSCYDGYTDYDCSIACKQGYYGRRCQEKCHPFCPNCDNVSGLCTSCVSSSLTPESNCTVSLYPVLKNAPEVKFVGNTNVTIRIDFNYTGSQPATKYNIYLKDVNEISWKHIATENSIPKENIDWFHDKLLPNRTYQLKIKLFTYYGYTEDNDTLLKIISFTTTCKVLSKNDINITLRGASADIIIERSSELCPLDGAMIRCGGYELPLTNEYCTLDPCSNSSIEIMSKNGNVLYSYMVQTGENHQIIQCLTTSETDTTSTIKWINNSDITTYIVQYNLIGSIYKECININPPETQQITTNMPEITLVNLRPYSTYELSIISFNSKDTLRKKVIDTKPIQYISPNELSDLSFNQINRDLRIISRINCNYIKGPLHVFIKIQCVSEWCYNKTNKLEGIHDENNIDLNFIFTVDGLTKYNVLRTIKRGNFENVTHYDHITNGTAPGPVLNLDIYSKTENSLYLRCKPPNPPMGKLHHYEITSYRSYAYKYTTVLNYNILPCTLWNNYHCIELNELSENKYYDIKVIPVNEPNLQGDSTVIIGITTQEKPENPQFVSLIWDENNLLRIEFPHPNKTNGQLEGFSVYVNSNKMGSKNIKNMEERFYSYELKDLPPAKNLTITVKVFNGRSGSDGTTNFTTTPPPMPHLNTKQVVIEPNLTNVTIRLPRIDKHENVLCFMAIIVTKLASSRHRSFDNFEKEDQQILNEIGISQDSFSWVAWKKYISEIDDVNLIIIGDDTTNRALLPNTEYNITIYINNIFYDKSTFFASSFVTKTLNYHESGSNLLLLLILLLLPLLAIAFFLFLRSKGIRLNMPLINNFRRQNVSTNNNSSSRSDAQLLVPIKLKPKPMIYQNMEDILEENKFSKPVRIPDLENYIKESLNNGEFERQHALFPRGQTKPWDFGTKPENKSKNRYVNLAAYDHSRVRLKIINSDENSEYINANYIDGYNCEKAFIATQGPKVNTLNDFWRMIWQEQVEFIVMIANLIEGGKKKVAKYWPEINENLSFENISVKYVASTVFANHEERIFKVQLQGEHRMIKQFHFTSWPDHGVPMYAQSLAPFLKKILALPQETAPIVVHCSAGVGRTGTLILADICLRMAAKQGYVDVLYHQYKLREQRPNMVDNVEQYKLVHLLLLHSLIAPETGIVCTENMNIVVEEVLASKEVMEQMKYLEDSSWQEEAMHTTATKVTLPIVNEKNRFMNIIPDEYSRIILTAYPSTDESSMYINAVTVNGFQAKGKFIVTQYPLKNTVGDFWRLILEQELTMIVCLNELCLNDDISAVFFPTKPNETLTPVPFLNINFVSVNDTDILHIYTLNLVNLKNKGTPQKITLIHLKKWTYQQVCPDSPTLLVSLFEEMNRYGKQADQILISCYDGVRSCGLYTALCFLIDKMKLEQICDVCLAVRTVRYSRKEFVRELEQFRFLYLCGLEYVKRFEMYSNFRL